MTHGEEVTVDESEFISLRKVIAFVFVGIIVYLVIILISQVDQVLAALSTLEWWWVLPVMMGLSFLNYIIRYVKWQYFLRKIDVNLSHTDSFSIFLAGFTLTTTPGKIGEAIKGYFCNELDGTPIAKTVPVVVSERVTDLFAMVILAAFAFIVGVSGSNQLLFVLFAGGMVFVGAIVLSSSAFYNKILKRMTSFGPLKRFQDSCDIIEDTMVKTLSPKPMLLSTAISVPGWFMECLEMWLLLSLLTGAGLPSFTTSSLLLLMQATFIHAGASTVGAVLFFLPGGLGGYEGFAWVVMTELFLLSAAIATVATLLIRFVTLWFSVVVGFIALAIVNYRRKCEQEASPPSLKPE